jgi:hypothetical protein
MTRRQRLADTEQRDPGRFFQEIPEKVVNLSGKQPLRCYTGMIPDQ